jgi:ubiquinone/menaquinone biosynthesis C-methylase UbiE
VKKQKDSVCSSEHADMLDNGFRRMIHNPLKILDGLIKENDTVLDIGSGPGTFTIDIAKKLNGNGKVIAVDLQDEMLDKLKVKARLHGVSDKIEYHKCTETNLGISYPADFILAFYMVHEVPDKSRFFNEVYSNLKTGGIMLFVEPKFHVSKKGFREEINIAESSGFTVYENRKIFISRAVLLKKI